ncbi:MAG: DegT/DnrJ/EryC1/StrS family aminotransferase [Deltaproteobacteria bacterium]|nr:MAG: DegT/DnrJ/EryC1/StrS family aminotransferase [Deltaproteobacteria bacterium]
MRSVFLPFSLPLIGKEEIDEVIDTLKSGWITTGGKTKQFEKEFAQYIGCNNAIAVSSCTAGLHLALIAAGVREGDEVITSPYTFAATAEVILHVGAKPVFVDIERDTYNIDPKKIEKVITKNTKAIIPIHIAGHPCEMEKIVEIAKQYNLLLIEDAAHAIAAKYQNRMVGTIGNITVFSFYATKNLTTGEGGMVCTDDGEIVETIRVLSLHGISADAWKRYSAEGNWYYEILYPGYKYNMTDIQASLGIHQLKKIETFLEKRREYVDLYNEGFSELSEVKTPTVRGGVRHAWHLYIIQLALEKLKISRNDFIKALNQEKVGVSVHFIPLHMHPYYRDTYGFRPEDFPISKEVYERVVSLPLYPNMGEDDIKDVISAVKKIVESNRR